MAEVLGSPGMMRRKSFGKSFSYCNLAGHGAIHALNHGLSIEGSQQYQASRGEVDIDLSSIDVALTRVEDDPTGLKRSASDRCLLRAPTSEDAHMGGGVPVSSAASAASATSAQPLDHHSVFNGAHHTMSRLGLKHGPEEEPMTWPTRGSSHGGGTTSAAGAHPFMAQASTEAEGEPSLSMPASPGTSMHSLPVTRITVERAGTALNISPSASRSLDSRTLLGLRDAQEQQPEQPSSTSLLGARQPSVHPPQPPQQHHHHHHHRQVIATHSSSYLAQGAVHSASAHGSSMAAAGSESGAPRSSGGYRRSRTVEMPAHSMLAVQSGPNAAPRGMRTSIGMPLFPAARDSDGAEEDVSSSDDEAVATTRLLTAALKASTAVSRTNHQRNHSWNLAAMPAGMGPGGGGGSGQGLLVAGGGRGTGGTPPALIASTGPSTPRSGDEEGVGGERDGSAGPHVSAHHRMQLPLGGDAAGGDEVLTSAAAVQRQRSSYHLTNGQAAVELFLRLSRARQTLDFAKRQASLFAALDHAELGVWDALHTLNELREYEAALVGPASGLDPDMPLLEHAFQAAELCRIAHPDCDWLHLVGLVHGLGKLLAHRKWGSQPQWAVCGESFPVGCRFDTHITGSQFFIANPDRRRRLCNTPTGVYTPRCGLRNVFMSWGAHEYLYLVLVLNNTALPQEALFLLRFAKFQALARPGGAYAQLLAAEDEVLLPLLRDFQRAITYRRIDVPGALGEAERYAYYDALVQKYIPGKLLW